MTEPNIPVPVPVPVPVPGPVCSLCATPLRPLPTGEAVLWWCPNRCLTAARNPICGTLTP